MPASPPSTQAASRPRWEPTNAGRFAASVLRAPRVLPSTPVNPVTPARTAPARTAVLRAGPRPFFLGFLNITFFRAHHDGHD